MTFTSRSETVPEHGLELGHEARARVELKLLPTRLAAQALDTALVPLRIAITDDVGAAAPGASDLDIVPTHLLAVGQAYLDYKHPRVGGKEYSPTHEGSGL